MEVNTAIRLRKSVRAWADRPLANEMVYRILEGARKAPSANNRQDWHIVVVRDPDRRRELGEAADQSFVGAAPVVLAVCGDLRTGAMACGIKRHVVDAAILLDHITLLATEHDLGTCWIGHFDQQKVKQILSIPEEWEVVELMPIGYPEDPAEKSKKRKPLAEIVGWNTWDGTAPEDFR
jgi:nitroreductase